jgi:hypothetical protein
MNAALPWLWMCSDLVTPWFCAVALRFLSRRWGMLHFRFYWYWACSGLGGAAGAGSGGGNWRDISCYLASSGTATFLWWFNRRRRDKARKLLGEKSAALLAALVRRARQAAAPRPVLVPGGAR